MKSERLLLLTAFIISGCSLCYELIIGAISSYISGDTVWQYSVTIGLYMAAMGFGSYISKYIRRNLYDWFIGIEVIIGIIGGLSATFIFLANLYLEAYQVVMYAFIIGIGILVGMEIPLLARILEVERGDLRHTLSSVFAFDYMGGLAGSVVFPLLFLPHLGYLATAFLCGVLNVAAAGIVIGAHYRKLRLRRIWRAVVRSESSCGISCTERLKTSCSPGKRKLDRCNISSGDTTANRHSSQLKVLTSTRPEVAPYTRLSAYSCVCPKEYKTVDPDAEKNGLITAINTIIGAYQTSCLAACLVSNNWIVQSCAPTKAINAQRG